jgi:hypothetical protein
LTKQRLDFLVELTSVIVLKDMRPATLAEYDSLRLVPVQLHDRVCELAWIFWLHGDPAPRFFNEPSGFTLPCEHNGDAGSHRFKQLRWQSPP